MDPHKYFSYRIWLSSVMPAKFSQVLSWEQKKKLNIFRYADNSGIKRILQVTGG